MRVALGATLAGFAPSGVQAVGRLGDLSDRIEAMPDDTYIGGMPPAIVDLARQVRLTMQDEGGESLPECRPPGPGQGLVVATHVGSDPDPSKIQTRQVLADLQALLKSERPFVRDAAAFIAGEVGPAASSLEPDLDSQDIHRSLWFSHALGRITCQPYAMNETLTLVPEAARTRMLGVVPGRGSSYPELKLVARLLRYSELQWPDRFFSNVVDTEHDVERMALESDRDRSVAVIADRVADETKSMNLRLDLLDLLRQLKHVAGPAADVLWSLVNGPDERLAESAATVLAVNGSERAIDAAREMLVRFGYGPSSLPDELCAMKGAADTLGPVLRKRLSSTNWVEVGQAITKLGCLEPIGNASVIRQMLVHPSWEVQLKAIEALKASALSDPETRRRLEEVQKTHWSGLVRKAATDALSPSTEQKSDEDAPLQFFFKCFHRCLTDHLRQCGDDDGVVDGLYVSPSMGEMDVQWERARRVRWPDDFPVAVPEDSRPDYGTSTYLRVDGGWLYGTDRWHYDGTIAFVDDQGNETPIGQWGDDAVAILDTPDFGKTLLGSSLFSVGEAGLLASLERTAEGWNVVPRVALPSPPWGWALAPNGTLLVADPYEAVAILKDGRIESLACPARAPANPVHTLRALARVAPREPSDAKKRELLDAVHAHETAFENSLRRRKELADDPGKRETWEAPEIIESWLRNSLKDLVDAYLAAGSPEAGIDLMTRYPDLTGEVGRDRRFQLYANSGRRTEARAQLADTSRPMDAFALRYMAAVALAEHRIDEAKSALDRIEVAHAAEQDDDVQDDPYLRILRQIAGSETPESEEAQSTDGGWPRPIQDYLAGRIDEKALTLASHRRDGQVDREKLCEALFYKGLSLAAKGRTRAARAYFRDVVSLNVALFFEHAVASYLSAGSPRPSSH